MSKWKFVGEHLPLEDMSIYLPTIFYEIGRYNLNDEFKVVLVANDLTLSMIMR